jgi:hypothetical protein
MPRAYLNPMSFSLSASEKPYISLQMRWHPDTPGLSYSPAHPSVGTDIAHLLSVASSPATRTGSENHPDELQVSDEVFAQIKANIIYLSLVLEHNGRGQPILSLTSGVVQSATRPRCVCHELGGHNKQKKEKNEGG